MKQIQTVVLGGTCRAVGYLLHSMDSLLIERSSSIGGEYFDAYKAATAWDRELQTPEACEFRKEMESRQMIREDQTDFYGLAPLIYSKLKEYVDRVMLMTELTKINRDDGGYVLSVYNQSGKQEIRCEEIIDTSLLCVSNLDFGLKNIGEKRFNAVIYNPNSATGAIGDTKLAVGRNDQESILRMKAANRSSFDETREQILGVWEKRPDELQGCRISSLAKEFDYDFKVEKHQIAENWQYVNPVQYDNPLVAIDAGSENSY